MKPLAFIVMLAAFAVVWPDEHEAMRVSSKVFGSETRRLVAALGANGVRDGETSQIPTDRVAERNAASALTDKALAAPILLEPSSRSATADECERATGRRPRIVVNHCAAINYCHKRICG